MVLGISPAIIIDHQLPFEYTITSRSTDVVVPLPTAPAADSAKNVLAEWNAIYDAYNKVAYIILGSMIPEIHRQFENPSLYDMMKKLKSMSEKQAGVERFVRNYNMHNMGKTISELHAMLIEYEKALPKKDETPQGKDKQVYIPKLKNPKPAAKENPDKDDTCHHCKEVGHWKRNCIVYLAEVLKKKKQVRSANFSGIFTMDLFAFPNKSWMYDTGRGTHICNTKHGFREARNLKQGALYLYVGNGVHAQVEAIRSFDLVLPNGLVICLDNCHYAPSIIRGVVFIHRLISKKHIEKLQQEGLLESTDDESFDQYVSCLSGRMTRKSFPHRPERAIDLLGILHTDVCGPLRHVSRQGSSYFITFTDDYSRYGYVYLFKHKHEVFETFKVFKNKVENQLGKTIKALRSDRGGEYISQEFKYYLKACGIVQQLNPPYTPQHNGVSERRNRYLKDTMGYYFNFLPENKIVVARYAKFFKKNLITQEVNGRAIDLEEIQDEDTSPSEITSKIPMEVEGFEPPQEEVISIYRSEGTHRFPNRLCLNVEVEEHKIQSMIDNMVWVLVVLPPGCKTVRSKWIFKKKTDMDGIVHTYKSRHVEKGYTQLYRVDYEETFSLVAKIRAIRILISIAAYYDYEIQQMDVKNAFLNGYLNEDIYMVQPEGFVDPNHSRKVCKLQRSIYVLKQASWSLNKRFDEEIKKFGFAQKLDEPCVYQKAIEGNVTFLILYVDDIIIKGNYIPSLQSVKDYIGKCFAMKDLEEATFILGIKIYRDRSKRLIGLDQNAYMDKILKRYNMDNSKRGHIPMQERLDLKKTQGASTPKDVKRI
nr:retrotransposon protein, putative, Ty1-copia subclass [Tanacetum cinerariifolium]